MNDELTWNEEEKNNNTSAPGGADQKSGVPATTPPATKDQNEQEAVASAGVSEGAPGRNAAHQVRQPDDLNQSHPWAPPGDAVLTPKEARRYLYDKYDMLLQIRRIQKFVHEKNPDLQHRKILGEVEPKKEGGVQLLIAQSSLDAFGEHDNNQHYRNGHEEPLDPNDPDFEALRKLASKKPYGVMIQGDATVTLPTPSETPADADGNPPKAEIINMPELGDDADGTTSDAPRGAVSREAHDFLKQQFEEYKMMFKGEKADREAAQKKRDEDRKTLEDEREQTKLKHQREMADRLDDLQEIQDTAIKLKMKNVLMKAAYNEATNYLPDDTKAKLTIDINQADTLELPGRSD